MELKLEKKRQNKRVGFTLLELVIVSVIIGILASLGIVSHRKIVVKARAAKAKHAISLIAEALKIYRLEKGEYVVVSAGAVDTKVGTNVTGINLAAVDNDVDFKYSVTAGGLIQANNPVAIGPCVANTTISFTLADGTWDIPACYK